MSICARDAPLRPGGPSRVTSEHPSLVLNRTPVPPDPSLHGGHSGSSLPGKTEQPFFFGAFAGGGVSPVHTGCSTAARRSFPGPGCLPAITPHQSLRPSLPETSTPAMVLPTSARNGRPPQAPLLLAPFLTTPCPSEPSRPGKPDRPHTAGLPLAGVPTELLPVRYSQTARAAPPPPRGPSVSWPVSPRCGVVGLLKSASVLTHMPHWHSAGRGQGAQCKVLPETVPHPWLGSRFSRWTCQVGKVTPSPGSWGSINRALQKPWPSKSDPSELWVRVRRPRARPQGSAASSRLMLPFLFASLHPEEEG